MFFPYVSFEEEWAVKKTRFGAMSQKLFCIYDEQIYAKPDERKNTSQNLFSYMHIIMNIGVGTTGPTVKNVQFALTFDRTKSSSNEPPH